MIAFKNHYHNLTLIFCLSILLMSACRSSVPVYEIEEPQKVILQAIHNPKVICPEYLELFEAEDVPDKPFAELSPVHARGWSYQEGISRLKDKAFLFGANAIINVRYKTQHNFEHYKDIYFLSGDAVVWKK